MVDEADVATKKTAREAALSDLGLTHGSVNEVSRKAQTKCAGLSTPLLHLWTQVKDLPGKAGSAYTNFI